MLTYLFHPHPFPASYDSTKVIVAFIVMLLLCVGSIGVTMWRRRQDASTKKLSQTWSAACLWFGITGLVMIIARTEEILFLAMRFLWVLWVAALIVYIVFQYRQFKRQHYEVVPKTSTVDPREKYLPGKKKRKK